MKPLHTILALTAALTIASHSEEKVPGTGAAADRGGMVSGMSMMDMAGKAQGNCMMASDTMDSLLKTVQEAKRSGDKAKMKAALQQVEDRIAGMRANMGTCMRMTGMMGNMMGGDEKGKGMMGGRMMGNGTMGGGMMNGGSMGGSMMPGADSAGTSPKPDRNTKPENSKSR